MERGDPVADMDVTLMRATLAAREPIAEGTMAFHFERPAEFAFRAGQAVDVVLPAPGVGTPLRHAFSIASAPFERTLTIATRMRPSPYKALLGALLPGAIVGLEGPFGSLTLHTDERRDAVLIAGGIGITPFLGMLRQAARARSTRRFALVFSNRRPEDAPFLEELQRLARQDGRFRLVATMTDMARSSRDWQGATRVVDAALVAEAAAGLHAPVYYLAGPPAMVVGVRRSLEHAGIADEDLRSEEFSGY